jgi:hypothetical protein
MPEGISSAGKTTAERETQIYTSGDYISKEIRRHKFATGLIVAAAAIVLGGFGYVLIDSLWIKDRKNLLEAPLSKHSGSPATERCGGPRSRGWKFLAYVRAEGGDQSIWIKQIQTNSNIQVLKSGDVIQFSGNNLVFSLTAIFCTLMPGPDPTRPHPSIAFRHSEEPRHEFYPTRTRSSSRPTDDRSVLADLISLRMKYPYSSLTPMGQMREGSHQELANSGLAACPPGLRTER